jgi:glycerophosphoryl diester phosphodiesterase
MRGTLRRPEVIGHGGAGHFFPGNCRASLEQALAIGVDRIEFDIQRAGDGRLVLVHDDKLALPGGYVRSIRGLTTPEIAALLPGLLTIDDAIELIGNRARILIDVKAPGYESTVIEAIRRHRLGADHGVSSTYANSLLSIRRAVPEIRIGISTGHLANGIGHHHARRLMSATMQRIVVPGLFAAVRLIGATDVMVQHRACSPRLVELMHVHGIRVTCWTVDLPRWIHRVYEMGVDGITSNRPDLVRDVIEAGHPIDPKRIETRRTDEALGGILTSNNCRR